jgi:hypothetical protein
MAQEVTSMKRMLLIVMSASAFALSLPGLALAAHHGHHHHLRRHKHGVQRTQTIMFGAPVIQASPPGTDHQAPNTSATTTPMAPSAPAGTITTFTNGTLTITLSDGTTVSGQVDETTEIRCENGEPSSTEQAGWQQDGSQSGPGPGDQQNREDDGGQDQPGSDDQGQGDDGQDGHDENAEQCTSAALLPGAHVRDAELNVSPAGSIWEAIELVK